MGKKSKIAKSEKVEKPKKTPAGKKTKKAVAAVENPNVSANVAACFRPDERAALNAAADKAGRSVSAFMREATLKAAGFSFTVRGPGRPRKAPVEQPSA